MLLNPLFHDRASAGEKLGQTIVSEIAKCLSSWEKKPQPIVYALPRGGLPIGLPIARLLQCPLDVIISKKITHPDNNELALGAVTASGEVMWSKYKPRALGEQFHLLEIAQAKAEKQLRDFALSRLSVSAQGALVILVDDGIATGMTMLAAAQALRAQSPQELWICAPVAPLEMMSFLQEECDRVIVLETPKPFYSVSRFYGEFSQVETEDAIECLKQQNQWL